MEVFRGYKRPLEAARGPWMQQEALGGPLEVLGGCKRPLEVLIGYKRPLEAAGGPWSSSGGLQRLQEALGGY